MQQIVTAGDFVFGIDEWKLHGKVYFPHKEVCFHRETHIEVPLFVNVYLCDNAI